VTSDNLYDRVEDIPFRSSPLVSDVHETFIHRNIDGIFLHLNRTKASSRTILFSVELRIKENFLSDMDIWEAVEFGSSGNDRGLYSGVSGQNLSQDTNHGDK
jgi:hypothetical protein